MSILYKKKTITAVLVQVVAIAAVPISYFAYPVVYGRFSTEDSWGEFASFAGMLLASILFFSCYRAMRRIKWSGWYLLLAIVTFFVAMEEISWGQRILRIRTPEYLSKINLQSETNLHNISWLFPHSTSYTVAGAVCIFFGFLMPLASLYLPSVRELVGRTNLPLPKLYLAPIFVAAGYFIGFSPFYNGAEIGECFLALALCCMAADHAVSTSQSRKGHEGGVQRIVLVLGTLIFLGAVAAYILLPIVISKIYMGEGPAFLHGVISGRSANPVGFYVAMSQRMALSALGFVFMLTTLWLPFARNRQQPSSAMCRLVGTMRLHVVPVFLLGSFLLGVFLTGALGSEAKFRARLTAMASTQFPERGMHEQALLLVDYLESRSSDSSGHLLSLRGFSLLNMGRPDDAKPYLKRALEKALQAVDRQPTNIVVLDRLAEIYDGLGDRANALAFWRQSLSIQEEKLQAADTDFQRTLIRMARADTLEAMADFDGAINEYLLVFDITDLGEVMTSAERGVTRLLRKCRTNEGLPRVTKEKMVELLDLRVEMQRSKTAWCD